MKIHIIGGSGTGKTTLADKLAEEYAIAHSDLDDLQWDNKAEGYGVKRDPKERDAMLAEILATDDWIIEGVYYKWCAQCFEDADKIYLLNTPRSIYRRRIIKRYVKRKLHIVKGKKETLKSLRALLKWADKYQKVDMEEIKKILGQYPDKVIELNT